MTNFTALYDACVLYPPSLRDLLLQLASDGLHRAKWSEKIHEEWIRNVLKNNPTMKIETLIHIKKSWKKLINIFKEWSIKYQKIRKF